LEDDAENVFEAACKLGLEGIVCKRLTAPYKSGPCKSWIKVKNPRSPAYLRIIDGTF
jgi:ATP-dependent DNA ligase